MHWSLVVPLTLALASCRGPSIPARTADAPGQAPEEGPGAPPQAERVREEVDLVLGGMLSPDHLGPERHAEILASLREHPRAYLDALAQRLPPEGVDAAQARAGQGLTTLLGLLRPTALEETAAVAGLYARRFQLLVLDETRPTDERADLDRQLAELRLLEGGVDRHAGSAWTAIVPVRVCATSIPGSAAAGLTVHACLCVEALSCSATKLGARIELTTAASDVAASCTECLALQTTCSLPSGAASTDAIAIAGGPTVGPIAPGTCIDVH